MDQSNKENNIDKEKEKKEENAKSTSFKNDDKKSSDNDSSKTNINLDLIKNLVKKSKDHEKKLLELSKKSNEHKEFFQNHKTDNELINNNFKNDYNINKIYNPFQNYQKANFQAYVGNIDNNNFTKGVLLKKEANNFFIYFGTFSQELKKQGKNCFYYCSKLEELFYGDYENDNFKEGYVSKFNDKGEIKF